MEFPSCLDRQRIQRPPRSRSPWRKMFNLLLGFSLALNGYFLFVEGRDIGFAGPSQAQEISPEAKRVPGRAFHTAPMKLEESAALPPLAPPPREPEPSVSPDPFSFARNLNGKEIYAFRVKIRNSL
ncbi:MAG: hypothetical protein GWM98_07125, partial [Nitrospinaceae bacterium]|nr:hypothetical protein [Nitrospinaceae bacterium]NIR54308.1 hypothetical protein [Nitrospinaceae bacterium]NIS84726.1 hypothetical protein [Nitrospinaceae bacterium]NIT81527.1 hypothetical protein [Nitrospinaceae bacterium]NIU43812.1 hypothetical protein [Nitrospinaceae bacterium]